MKAQNEFELRRKEFELEVAPYYKLIEILISRDIPTVHVIDGKFIPAHDDEIQKEIQKYKDEISRIKERYFTIHREGTTNH